VTGITPTGVESTLTRKQLLAYRDAEEARLRAKWASVAAEEEESANDTSK
jgi:hypothetical protein